MKVRKRMLEEIIRQRRHQGGYGNQSVTRVFRLCLLVVVIIINYLFFFNMFKYLKSAYSAGCFVRLMSAYPKHYVDPIGKNLLNKTKISEEYNKLIHMPTKAAKNDESRSVFYNEIVKKMVNYITKGGNKKYARTILENSLEIVKRTQIERISLGQNQICTADPYVLIFEAINNCRPLMELNAIKRGGVTYWVPVPVTEKRSHFLAMKWILDAAREKSRSIHLPEKLAWEILDAAYGQGRVINKRNDLHKQCESNRAYAHYRWS